MQRSATTLTLRIALAPATLLGMAAAACAQPVPGPTAATTGIVANLETAVITATILRERAQSRQREARSRLAAQTTAACEELPSGRCSAHVRGAGPIYKLALDAAIVAQVDLARSTDEIDNDTRIIESINAALEQIERATGDE